MAPASTLRTGRQKNTFLPYLEGIPVEGLRLGSLYLNPLNPLDGPSASRWAFKKGEEQVVYEKAVSRWIWKMRELKSPFNIAFEDSKARSLTGGFGAWLNFDATKDTSRTIQLQGQSGRRVRIEEPELFLEEVMDQPGVNEWIRIHASIVRKGKHGINKWEAPKLWMVTALQYVTGGEMHTQDSASTRIGGTAGADVSLAVQAPPGTLNVKTGANYENSHSRTVDSAVEDEQVWFAQFMPVTIEFDSELDKELSTRKDKVLPKTIKRVELQEIEDLALEGIRSTPRELVDPVSDFEPGLSGHVTIQEDPETILGLDKCDDSKPCDDLVVDDAPYVLNEAQSDWERYDACKAWLKNANRHSGENIHAPVFV